MPADPVEAQVLPATEFMVMVVDGGLRITHVEVREAFIWVRPVTWRMDSVLTWLDLCRGPLSTVVAEIRAQKAERHD